jgi:hypothetical protein
MSGNYPSPTAKRINYDLDGTRCFYKTANATTTTLTEDGSFMINMNNESTGTTPVITLNWSSTTNPGHAPFILLKFPNPVNITGIKGWQGGIVAVAASNDTTNGVDGTWTAGTGYTPETTGYQQEWSRSGAIAAQAFVGVRWLRLSLATGTTGARPVGKVLIYGTVAAGVDTLDFWDPTTDVTAAPDLFEFGDRARGTTVTKTFRIKNLSTVLKAKTITVTRTIATDTTPSVPGFHLFSLDGVTWIGSLSIGDLAPGAISPVIMLRQAVPTNAVLWLWQMVAVATPNTWEV